MRVAPADAGEGCTPPACQGHRFMPRVGTDVPPTAQRRAVGLRQQCHPERSTAIPRGPSILRFCGDSSRGCRAPISSRFAMSRRGVLHSPDPGQRGRPVDSSGAVDRG
jgi:hypothetical protein